MFTDKLIIAVLGALIALVLNRIFLAYDKNKKNEDIRKLIVSDLKRQKLSLMSLQSDIKRLLPALKYGYVQPDNEELFFDLNYQIQTDTFKSHTRMEFFKAFDEDDFHTLMEIYKSLKTFEELDIDEVMVKLGHDVYDLEQKFRGKVGVTQVIQVHHENLYSRISAILLGVVRTKEKIERFTISVNTKENRLYY